MGPQVVSDEGQGIGEGRLGFDIPGRGAHGQGLRGRQVMSQQHDQREQAEQGGGGALDSPGRPLALGFEAQMGAHFLEGHFHTPAHHHPPHDVERAGSQVGGEEGSGVELAQRVAHQHPAQRQGVVTGPPLYNVVVPLQQWAISEWLVQRQQAGELADFALAQDLIARRDTHRHRAEMALGWLGR